MSNVIFVRRYLWFSFPILALALILGLGCGTSSAPVETASSVLAKNHIRLCGLPRSVRALLRLLASAGRWSPAF